MITLTPDQENASAEFDAFMISDNEQCMAITGGAGFGKTALVKHLLQGIKQKQQLMNLLVGKSSSVDMGIHLTATTNQAAKVMGLAANMDAGTIHSLLGLHVYNDYRTGNTTLKRTKKYTTHENKLIVIDEGSYIDSFLLKEILAGTKGSKVLFILDPYQLAPPKDKVIAVDAMSIRKGVLTTVNRNPGPIAELAGLFREAVKTGVFPAIVPNGKEILHATGPEFQKLIDAEYLKPVRNTRILAWTNNKVQAYNDHVRGLYGFTDNLCEGEEVVANQPVIIGETILMRTDETATVERIGLDATLCGVPGKKVQLSGFAKSFFVPNSRAMKEQLIKKAASEKDWGTYFDLKNQCADLRPAYSSTVHKAQGSTMQKVFIDLNDIGRNQDANEVARLLYVASSRPTDQVIFYGQLPKEYGGV